MSSWECPICNAKVPAPNYAAFKRYRRLHLAICGQKVDRSATAIQRGEGTRAGSRQLREDRLELWNEQTSDLAFACSLNFNDNPTSWWRKFICTKCNFTGGSFGEFARRVCGPSHGGRGNASRFTQSISTAKLGQIKQLQQCLSNVNDEANERVKLRRRMRQNAKDRGSVTSVQIQQPLASGL